MQIFPGFWCDVFAHPEGIGLLVFEPALKAIRLYINSTPRATLALPDSVLYLRGAADASGRVAFIAQPGSASGTMIGIMSEGANIIPLACYSRPGVTYDSGTFLFAVQTSDATWRQFTDLSGSGTDQPIPVWPGGTGRTSMGISQILGTHVVWHDEIQRVTINNLAMLSAVTANGVTVGQGQESGMVGIGPQGQRILAMDFAPQEPRIAWSPVRNVWAVCSHNLQPVVGYNEMPPFTPLPETPPDPPITDPTKPPSSPIVTFPGYVPPAQASYNRPGFAGPYFATDLRAGNFSTRGNVEMIVNGTVLQGNQQVNRPVFVDIKSVGNDPEKIRGFLAGANDDSMANAGIVACRNWHKERFGAAKSQLVRYFDGTPIPQSFIDGCEKDAIVQVQCYPRSGETPAQAMARFTESVDRVLASGRKCGIARGFNTKYGGLRLVLDVQAPLCDLVRSRPGVILDAWFSHGRWYAGVESGAEYCAELLAWEQVLGTLFTGLP